MNFPLLTPHHHSDQVERSSLAAAVTADISSLNPFQRAEQRQEFIARATQAIKEVHEGIQYAWF